MKNNISILEHAEILNVFFSLSLWKYRVIAKRKTNNTESALGHRILAYLDRARRMYIHACVLFAYDGNNKRRDKQNRSRSVGARG